jgi:hypothetical protein
MSLFHTAFHLANYLFPNGGTCLEFGVNKGNTYCYQAGQILTRYPKSSLIGFDSWQGLPEETAGVWAPERHSLGELAVQKGEVLERLRHIGAVPDDTRFRFVDGFFSESLTDQLRSEIRDLVFINVDVDIHRSTLELLDFVRPLLRPGVVLYWDDWKDPRDESPQAWGEHLAWTEWYSRQNGLHVETIEINPVNQRSMVVTQVGEQRLSPPLPPLADIRYHAFSLASAAEQAPELDSDYQRFLRLKQRLKCVPLLRPVARAVRAIVR